LTEKKRRQYSAEFKKEAVGLVTNQGYSVAEAAKNLGIYVGILNRWRREQLKAPQNAFPGTGHRSPEVEELERLREENRRLKMEREILKKAAAFFAKESG
jgi:transposase